MVSILAYVVSDLHDETKELWSQLFDVSFVAQQVVEQHDSSSEDDLRVARVDAVLAEVDDLPRRLKLGHKLDAKLSLVDVGQHLEADQVVVVSHFLVWILDIEALHVLEQRHVKSLPVTV